MYLARFLTPKKKRIYLDMAAATPLRKQVLEAMTPYFTEQFGNPSSIHQEGVVAKQAVAAARKSVAELFEVKPGSVLFTGNGTESNNIALVGYLRRLQENGRPFSEMEVITTALEHPSVTEVLPFLRELGVTVKLVPVDECGLIELTELRSLINERTVMVSTAYVNSEIGVIQPVGKISRLVREMEKSLGTRIAFHLDAAQAPLWLPCQLDRVGADLMSFDAGKCFGPKGVGILVLRKDVMVAPVLHGGGQESNRRPGTENVAGIVGAAKALELAQGNVTVRAAETIELRDYFIARLRQEIPTIILNGPEGEQRVANNVNISIPGLDTEFVVVVLDKEGIAASTKSACSGAGGGESTVVKTISGDAARAASTIRFTLGSELTKTDLDRVVAVLKTHVEKQQTTSQ